MSIKDCVIRMIDRADERTLGIIYHFILHLI